MSSQYLASSEATPISPINHRINQSSNNHQPPAEILPSEMNSVRDSREATSSPNNFTIRIETVTLNGGTLINAGNTYNQSSESATKQANQSAESATEEAPEEEDDDDDDGGGGKKKSGDGRKKPQRSKKKIIRVTGPLKWNESKDCIMLPGDLFDDESIEHTNQFYDELWPYCGKKDSATTSTTQAEFNEIVQDILHASKEIAKQAFDECACEKLNIHTLSLRDEVNEISNLGDLQRFLLDVNKLVIEGRRTPLFPLEMMYKCVHTAARASSPYWKVFLEKINQYGKTAVPKFEVALDGGFKKKGKKPFHSLLYKANHATQYWRQSFGTIEMKTFGCTVRMRYNKSWETSYHVVPFNSVVPTSEKAYILFNKGAFHEYPETDMMACQMLKAKYQAQSYHANNQISQHQTIANPQSLMFNQGIAQPHQNYQPSAYDIAPKEFNQTIAHPQSLMFNQGMAQPHQNYQPSAYDIAPKEFNQTIAQETTLQASDQDLEDCSFLTDIFGRELDCAKSTQTAEKNESACGEKSKEEEIRQKEQQRTVPKHAAAANTIVGNPTNSNDTGTPSGMVHECGDEFKQEELREKEQQQIVAKHAAAAKTVSKTMIDKTKVSLPKDTGVRGGGGAHTYLKIHAMRFKSNNPAKIQREYLIEWTEEYEGEHGLSRFTWEPAGNIERTDVDEFKRKYVELSTEGVRFVCLLVLTSLINISANIYYHRRVTFCSHG
jgi:hypothetical protein